MKSVYIMLIFILCIIVSYTDPIDELQDLSIKQIEMKFNKLEKISGYKNFIEKHKDDHQYDLAVINASITIGNLYYLGSNSKDNAILAMKEYRKAIRSPLLDDILKDKISVGIRSISASYPDIFIDDEIKIVEDLYNRYYQKEHNDEVLYNNISNLIEMYYSLGKLNDMQRLITQLGDSLMKVNLNQVLNYPSYRDNYFDSQTLVIGNTIYKYMLYKPVMYQDKSKEFLPVAIASKYISKSVNHDYFKLLPNNIEKDKKNDYLSHNIYNFIQDEIKLLNTLKKDNPAMFPKNLDKFMEGMDASDKHLQDLLINQLQLLKEKKYNDAESINQIAYFALWGVNRPLDSLKCLDTYLGYLEQECKSYGYSKLTNANKFYLKPCIQKSMKNRLPVSIYFLTQYVNAYSEQPDLPPDTLIKTIQEALKTNKIEAEYPLVKLENPDMKSYLTGDGYTAFITELRRWTELQKMYPKYMPAEMTVILKAVTDAKIELKLPQEKK